MASVHRSQPLVEFEVEGARGKRFEPTTERELDEDLRALALRLPGADKGLLGVVEFPAPRGVPDLLCVTRGVEGLGRRLSSGLPFVESPSDCAVVAALHVKRPRTVAAISADTGITTPQVERRLRALTHAGVVSPHGSGFLRSPELVPIGRMYAFEAKVSNWRRGLSQAMRYSAWADAAALVLLRPPADITQIVDQCTAFGLGFAIRDEWVRKPRIGRPHPGLRLEASERLALEVSRIPSEPFASAVGLKHR